MARIDLVDLAHSYGGNDAAPESFALKPVTMTWRQGGAYALLGPSGCGKTTLLNLISGIVTPSRGKILFDGADITPLSTQKRNIAQVFQFPVIYDTMTVGQNLAFPLKNRGVPKAEIDARVKQIADLLDLTPYLDRKATRLTADAKQKISLGRGLVRSDVAAVLFDEPLTVIDPELKWQLRSKLKALHRELDLTMIYVTHDQTEALTFADTVVVMHDGRVVQSGTPAELFDKPAHTFVGYFIGSPGMNIVPAEVQRPRGPDRRPRHPACTATMTACRRARRSRSACGRNSSTSRRPRPGCCRPRSSASTISAASASRGFASATRNSPRACRRDFRSPATRPDCVFDPSHVHVYADSRLVEGKPDGQDHQPEGLVPGAAGVPDRRVLRDPAADDGRELFDAGHLRQQPVLLERRRLVQGIARSHRPISAGASWPRSAATCCSPRSSSPSRCRSASWWRCRCRARAGRVAACLVIMALPLLIPWNVVGTIWQIFGRPDIGLLGYTLNSLGINYNYVSNEFDAWATVIVMDVWHWTSLVALLCYAGLKSIPDAYYQAAQIDGASRWAVFTAIQLPKMNRVLLIAVLLRFMDSFMIYTEPFVVTGGGPGNSTTFVSIELVKIALGQFDLGKAAALSLVYNLIILIVCWVFYTVMTNAGAERPPKQGVA